MFRTFVERRGAARRGGGRPAIEFSTNYLRASFFSAGEPESFRTGPRLRDANDRATLLFLFYLPVISWKRNYRNTGTLFNRALSITKASCIKEFLRLPNRCRHRDRFIGNSLSRTFRNEPRALCGRASWSLKKAKKKKKEKYDREELFPRRTIPSVELAINGLDGSYATNRNESCFKRNDRPLGDSFANRYSREFILERATIMLVIQPWTRGAVARPRE